MERNFYTDDFEELIRQKTGQYKLYPSDKVWKEIYNSLHSRRRRFVLGMSVLIGGILILAGIELLQPSKHVENIIKIAHAEPTKSTPVLDLSDFVEPKKITHFQSLGAILPDPDNKKEDNPDLGQDQILQPAAGQALAVSVETETYGDSKKAPGAEDQSEKVRLAWGASETTIAENSAPPVASASTIENLTASFDLHLPLLVANSSPTATAAGPLQAKKPDQTIAPAELSGGDMSPDRRQINWLQEFALEHLTPTKQHRMSVQLYFSPTFNYRNLTGANYNASKSSIQTVPVALVHFGNVNDFVDHTPGIGYEAGSSLMYRITRNLTFKVGLQFNYSRYNIMAYSTGPVLGTIALNAPYVSYLGLLADTLASYSNASNFGGKARITLQNKYYQLSSPLGLELKVLGNGKLQLFVAGSIQPTYLINRNSYLLTTDYMSYVKEPSLFRRWNVNGGLEAFIAYQAGGLRWQIGPQFRYQLLSTYTDDYPLRENLKEYGIKIGISKIFR
jgi:hypothetical protein